MRYILSPKVALRGWELVPRAYYIRGAGNACGLSLEEFNVLIQCDGKTDTAPSTVLDQLTVRGLCKPAEDGDDLTDWQRYRHCNNRYFPAVNWAITGKCNFNCRHCFNATDNNILSDEFSWEECLDFIRQFDECGVQNVSLTGGEPMLHPNFMDICREINRRGMVIAEITTNGSFITPQILDELDTFGIKPLIKISFDGLGHHDWFRDKPGAEQEAIEKIKLVCEKGFRVRVQTNVHKGNQDTILPTVKLMDSIGVAEIRVIRTGESPRWEINGSGLCLSTDEYYMFALELTRECLAQDLQLVVDIWQVVQLRPHEKTYHHNPIEGGIKMYRDSLPICRGARGNIAVSPNGDVLPCNQMSGWFKKQGIKLGNVHETPLRELLTDSEYLKSVCYTVGELRENNPKCKECEHWKLCLGGCRACGILFEGSYYSYDPAKCLYFEHWFDAFSTLFSDEWRCVDDF